MIDNGAQPAEDWTWMQTIGYAMRCQQVPVRPPVETSNRYVAMESDEPGVPDPPEPVAGTSPRAAKSDAAVFKPTRKCCGSLMRQCKHECATAGKLCKPKPGLKTFIEKRAQSLGPLSDEWEKLTAILDSGASVTVVPPHVGRDYEVTRGDAAAAGVRYVIADGNEIPNLGEKLFPIMTREGTWRGLKAEVADISKAAQSVRSLVKTGHRVVFGDGEGGSEHYI